jgi:hypothetical protein
MYLMLFIMVSFSQELPEPKIKAGFPIELPAGIYSGLTSAQFYDFDNDGKLEIVFVTNAAVYIVRNDGSNFPGWPKGTPYLTGFSEPAIGDLDGDGEKEIIVTTFNNGGGLYAWHYDGTSVQGFPIIFQDWEKGWMLGPTLFDINGDNKLEIFISVGNKVYGFNQNGSTIEGWPRTLKYPYGISSPKVADIDNDGIAEILVSTATVISQDSMNAFAIHCMRTDGSEKPNWPFIQKNEYVDPTRLGVIGNFTSKEYKVISFATSRYPPIEDMYCYILNPSGGIETGWPQKMVKGLFFNGGLSMIDLSAAYDMNILIAGDKWGYNFAWNNFGNLLPKFPYKLPPVDGFWYPGITSVPIPYLDIQNEEFVIFTSTDISKNDTGYLYASGSDSAQMPWSPIKTIGYTSSTPAFADLENDGSVELVVLTRTPFSNRQLLYVWEFPGIPFDKQRFPWPVGSGNRWNTCEFGFEPTDTVVVAVRSEEGLPTKTQLYQNYPNPFNPATKIKYDIDKQVKVKLCIYNTLGQMIATLVDAEQKAGTYEVVWDASKFSSGVYYDKIETSEYTEVKKLILLK